MSVTPHFQITSDSLIICTHKKNVIIQRWVNLKELDDIKILHQTHHFEQLSLIFITAAQPWLARDKAIYV